MSKIYNIEEILEQVKEVKGKVISINNADVTSDSISNAKDESQKFIEGKLIEDYVTKHERNREARNKCIEHYNAVCQVCEFDFEKKYGVIGRGYIHVHHIRAISTTDGEYEVDAIKDLRPVCPNCHAMLHYKGTSDINISIEKLKEIIEKNRK